MINVKCFGVAREIANNEFIQFDAKISTVNALRQALLDAYPDFSSINGFMIAVNQEYATEEMQLSPNDEIAIIPPVSGG